MGFLNIGTFSKCAHFGQNQISRTFWHGSNVPIDVCTEPNVLQVHISRHFKFLVAWTKRPCGRFRQNWKSWKALHIHISGWHQCLIMVLQDNPSFFILTSTLFIFPAWKLQVVFVLEVHIFPSICLELLILFIFPKISSSFYSLRYFFETQKLFFIHLW